MRLGGPAGVSHRRKRRGWTPDTAMHEDLVKRQFRADAPDRLWFCDITQHRSRDGWIYCAAVIDAFSRRIVGWSISDRVTDEIVVDAREMARRRRRPEPGTVVHADRGVQYTSWLFGHRLRQAGLLGSMGRVASPVGTPRSAISAPPTTKPFTRPPRSRHDPHTRTVRETGSGSTRLTGGCIELQESAGRAA